MEEKTDFDVEKECIIIIPAGVCFDVRNSMISGFRELTKPKPSSWLGDLPIEMGNAMKMHKLGDLYTEVDGVVRKVEGEPIKGFQDGIVVTPGRFYFGNSDDEEEEPEEEEELSIEESYALKEVIKTEEPTSNLRHLLFAFNRAMGKYREAKKEEEEIVINLS